MRMQNISLRTLIVWVGLVLIGRPGYAQDESTARQWSADQQAVWETVRAYSTASRERDLERYLSYWHPGFLGWHNGDDAPTDKAARIKGLTWYFANTTPEDYTVEPMGVQVFGNAGVVHYKIRQTLRMKDGKRSSGVAHWTDVLVKDNGRWLLISDHGGAIPTAEDTPPNLLDLRLDKVKIKVTDMDAAMTFYGDVLGFEILSDAYYPEYVILKSDVLPLILERADHRVEAEYPEVTQTKLTLQSYDLRSTMEQLKQKGVTFLVDPPTPYGRNSAGVPLGLSTRFRDPFGHEFSMVEQQVSRGEAFTGVRIYNTGFDIPDVEAARSFYAGVLGFEVRSEQYYPNIPLGHTDGSFAFMLHGHPQMKPATLAYPGDTQVLVVFATEDLATTMKVLQQRGVAFLHDTPQQGADGRFVAFKDPFGNVAELLEH